MTPYSALVQDTVFLAPLENFRQQFRSARLYEVASRFSAIGQLLGRLFAASLTRGS